MTLVGVSCALQKEGEGAQAWQVTGIKAEESMPNSFSLQHTIDPSYSSSAQFGKSQSRVPKGFVLRMKQFHARLG